MIGCALHPSPRGRACRPSRLPRQQASGTLQFRDGVSRPRIGKSAMPRSQSEIVRRRSSFGNLFDPSARDVRTECAIPVHCARVSAMTSERRSIFGERRQPETYLERRPRRCRSSRSYRYVSQGGLNVHMTAASPPSKESPRGAETLGATRCR